MKIHKIAGVLCALQSVTNLGSKCNQTPLNSQEKLKTMPMQNFGVTNKEHYGMLWYFWSGQ